METLVNLPGLLPNSGNVFPRRSFLAQESSSNFDESQYQLAERSCSSQHKHVWLSIQLNVCGDGDHGAGRSGTWIHFSGQHVTEDSLLDEHRPQRGPSAALQKCAADEISSEQAAWHRSWTKDPSSGQG